jgi:cobalamin biosynthesis Mg chelatase CobN
MKIKQKMKKITILILVVSLLLSFGCKTKRVLRNEYKEVVSEQSVIKKDSTIKKTLKDSIVTKNVTVNKEDKKDEKTEVEITGKVDKDNPASYYNIVDGDTIDLFRITGNANFIFKSSKTVQKSNINNNTSSSTVNNKESIISVYKAVETVKNTAKEVKEKTVEVVKKDFTIGSYFVFLIFGIVAIVLCIFIFWLSKSNWLSKIINKFKL